MRKSFLLTILSLFVTIFAFSINASWNYTVTTSASNPVTISSPTILGSGGDDVGYSLAWPFTFQIYDDVYTTSNSISMTSNGYFRFDNALALTARTAVIPTSSSFYGQFLSYGGNLDGYITSNVVYQLTGTTGNRVLTFAFTYYTFYNLGLNDIHADVQVSFYEATGQIVVDYSNVGGTNYSAAYIGMNAGDGIFGNDQGNFPTSSTRITYTPGSAINPPAALSATVASSCQNNLVWTKNSTNSDVIVAYNTSNSFGTPSNGTSYAVNGSLGTATILYIGSGTSYSHTSLPSNTQYYYKIWSKSSSNIYSATGLTDNKTTNPVTTPGALTSSNVTSSQIDLAWSLNSYSDNVIVTYNTVNSFATPQNGTSYAVNSQIGGQQTVLYKGSATSFSHTGLSINTTYYYKIWSYGCQNDYSSTGQTLTQSTSSSANPTFASVSATSSCKINLTWSKNASGDDVMILRNTTSTFGTPSSGTSYTVNYTFPTGGTVIYNGSGTSYSNTGLVDNQTYYYKAFSVSSGNNYSTGVTGNATTLTIANTTGFSATAISSSQINLAWTLNGAGDNVIITYNTVNNFTSPSNGTSYTVGNQIASGGGTVLYIGSLSSFSHTGLSVNSTYYYKIWSYDCGLNYSSPGQTDNATTQNVSNPTGFSSTANGSCKINLSWTPTGGNDVMIIRNTTSAFGTPVNGLAYVVGYNFAGGGKVIYSGSGSSYSDISLMDNTQYFYKIYSFNSSNYYSSGLSSNATTTTIANAANFTATGVSTSQINLAWDALPAGIEVIVAYNSTNSFGTPTDGVSYSVGNTIGTSTVAYKGSLAAFNHTSLSINTTYYYKIWTSDCGLNYSTGQTASATTSNIVNPTTFTANSTGSCEINLIWVKNASNNDVMILRNTTNTFATPTNNQAYVVGYNFAGGGTVIYSGNGTSYTNSTLLDNTTYYYKAFSVTSSNVYSSGISANATTTLIPNPASLTASAVGMSQINLSWPTSGSNNVIVTYNLTGTFSPPVDGSTYTTSIGADQIIYQGTGSSFNHTGLNFNTTYYYKIWYYDCGKNYSSPGTTSSATTGNISNPQAFDGVALSSCKDSLYWTKNVTNDDVMVAYSTSNNFATPTTGVAYSIGYTFPFGQGTIAYVGSATNLVHSPLYKNTKYYYKIWSKSSTNYYSTGLLDSITTPALSDPQSFSVSSTGTTNINLGWNLNTAGDNVIIAYNTTNTFATPVDGLTYTVGNQIALGQGIVLYKGSLSAFNHTGLNLNTTYYYKIWSYDCANSYSSPGKTTSGTTGTVANPQSFDATAISSTQIDLSWTKNSSGNDVMIAYNSTNSFATPSNGITYVVGNQIASGQGTVLYIGPATSFSHTALNMNTTYYYKLWSKDGSSNYSTGLTDNATTTGISNPTAFDATTASSTQINLTWTKAVTNDSIMIVYNTTNNFATLVNGFAYVIGNQVASGQGTVIYRGSASAFNHTGLSATTKYYYKVYEYNSANYYSSPGLLDSAITNAPGVATFPYLETFDTQIPDQSNMFSCQTYYPLTSGWNNVQTVDDIDWVVRQGYTPNGSFGQTGPAGDHTTGNGYYLYTEASSCYNKAAWLVSPLFNFVSLSNPRLEFYYFMLGSGTGSINVQISTNGGATWSTTNLFNVQGQQQTSQSAAWGHADISLAAYAGMSNIKLRIKGTTGFNYASDMAIDDIRVYQPQNMAITSVTTEQDTIDVVLGATNQEVIRVKITTLGAFSPLSLGQLAFNTTGTTNTSEITNARVFFTGTSPNFNTTQQFGSAIPNPSGAFPITGTQVLVEGDNYFWLTYDISSSATIGNKVDAQCIQTLINGITHIPTITNPTGDKTIVGQIIVGTGTSSNWNGPIYPSYYYGAHESVYLASELGTGAKEINKFAWYKASGINITDKIDNITVYMKNSSTSQLTSGSYSLTGYTQVYQGPMPNYAQTGWMDIILNNTFFWDGTSNLHLLVVQDKPAVAWTPYPYYNYTSVSPNKARGAYNYTSPPASLTATNQRPNVKFIYVLPASMSYASSEVIQPNTTNVAVGTANTEIIGIKVETNNTANPLNLTKLLLSTVGTTSASDISNAKVYYTGTSNAFATTNQFGTTVTNPNGTFSVTGSQSLQPGTNYFWVAYTVSATATPNNILDATCDSITVAGNTYAPTVTNPNGGRAIKQYLIVGTGTNSDYTQPLHVYYYHAWEAIYTSSEMGNAKDISALAFYKASGSNTVNPILNVTIYLKNTTALTLGSGTYSTVGYTQVYQGNFTNNAPSGWMEVPLSTNFAYDGTSNLEVLVVQSYGAYFTGYPYWAYSTVSPNRARSADSYTAAPTNLTSTNRLANIRFEYSDPTAMSYVSSTVTQNNTSYITAGIADQDIIGIEIVTVNSSNPLSATSFTFNTTGSSDPTTDITNAKVYYTGGSNTFSAINQFGNVVANPNGTFTVTGSQTLTSGTNYFWLAYDLPSTAVSGHWVDAQCTSVTVGSAKTPSITNPIGNRTIVGALSGEKIIGVGGDYTTFTSAINALNTYGVSGWVKFRVLAGTYNEQIVLSPYSNSSTSNTVSFESYSGDSTDVILTYSPSSSTQAYTIQVSGSSNYIIRNMTIKAVGTTYATAISLNGSVSNLVINNNLIYYGSGTSYYSSGIYAYNNVMNNVRISNNLISGTGGYGLYLRSASSSSQNLNMLVDSNDILSGQYGAYLMYNNALIFRHNKITVTGGNFSYGIYSYGNNNGTKIFGNRIISSGNTTAYGIYSALATGSSLVRNTIYNNFIAVTSTSLSSGYGIYNNNNTYTDYFYNNINYRGGTGNNRYAFYLTGGNNIRLQNNMVVASNGGVCIYLNAAGTLNYSDYNNFYTTGSVLGYYGATSAPSLAAWRTYSGEDANSISSNPQFVSNTDLHVTNVALNNLGNPITGITSDIDNDLRSTTTPDIGADEFSVDIDGGVTALNSPVSGCNTSQAVEVLFKNFGQTTLTSATINWKLDGVTKTPFSWTGSLATSQTASVIIGSATSLAIGNHTIVAWSTNPNGMTDQLTSNDSLTAQFSVSSAPVVNAGTDTTICDASTFTTNGTATGYTSLSWSSSGSGTFTGGTSLTATYTPSAADISAGSIYLKLTATSTGCGNTSDSLLLTISSMPALSFVGLSSSYCPGATPSTLAGTPTGGVFAGPGIIGNTFNPATAGSGTHTIYYIYTLGSCVDSASQTTMVSPTLTPTITGLAAGYCISSPSSTLTGTPVGGTWSGAITSNVFNPATVGVGIKTVTYTVTDASTSCVFDTTYTTEVYTNPVASFTGLNPTYCTNDLADTLMGSPAGGTFGGTGMNGNIFSPTLAGSGTFLIQYIINNGVGCSDTASQYVTVNTAYYASFTGLASQYCSTSAVATLSGTPAGGTFSGPGITGNQFNPASASIGTNYITYSYTAGNGCTDTTTLPTIVNQTPTANAGPDLTIINGADTILYGSATGGSLNYAYSWTPVNKIQTGQANLAQPNTVALTASQIFTLLVTDNVSGCSSSDQMQVTTTSTVFGVSTSANPVIMCAGDSSFIQAVASGGNASNYSYLWSSTPSGYTSAFAQDYVKPIVTTTYTVLATDGISYASSSVVIQVNPLPTVTLTGLSSAYCSNAASVNMVGSPVGGTFSGTGVIGSVFNPALAGPGNHTITYQYTNSNGCTNYASTSVLINQTPVAYAGADDTIAFNTDTILYGSATGGGNYLWNWSPSSYLISTNVQNPSTTVLAASQEYILQVADSITGCNSKDTVTIFIKGGPLSAIANASPTAICPGSSSQLNVTPSGGTGTYSYGWSSTPAGFTSTLKNPVVSPTTTTTYTVAVTSGNQIVTKNIVVTVNAAPMVSFTGLSGSYCIDGAVSTLIGSPAGGTFTGAGISGNDFDPAIAGVGNHIITYSYTSPVTGCIGTSNSTTTVNALPVVNAGVDVTIYTGPDTTLYGSASGGSGLFTYSWTPATLVISPSSATTATTILTSSAQFTLTATDNSNGCSNSDDVIVTIGTGTLSVSAVANPSVICAGDASNLTALPSGGTGTYTFSWSSNPIGFSSTQMNPTVTPTATTTYTVVVNDGTNNASSSAVITVNPLPVVSFSGLSGTYCSNSGTSVLTGVPSGGTFSGSGITGSNFDPSTLAQGSYNITYSYTSPTTGCFNSTSQSTSVYQAPFANAGSDVTIQTGHDTLLYGSAIGGGNYNWGWSPTLMLVNASLQTAQTVQLTSTQLFTLTVTDSVTGCFDDDNVVVFVGSPVLSATINVNKTTICAGDSVQLTVLASGGTSNYTYSWTSIPSGFTSTSLAPLVKPSVTTLYSVQVSDGVNTVTKNITITVNQKPSVALAGLSTSVCDGAPADTLLGFPAGGTFNGVGVTSNLFNPVIAGVGTHYISYSFTDANGCKNTDFDTIVVNANPISNAGSDATIYTGNDTILYGSGLGGSGNYAFEWSPASLLLNAFAQNATTQILTMTQKFTLKLTDQVTGCYDYDSVKITVKGGALTAIADANPDTICYGNSTQLDALVTGGSGNYTYLWTSNPAGFTSSLSNPVVTPAVTTTFTVIADDGNGTAVNSIAIVVETQPIVQVASFNAVNCENGGFDTLVGSPAGGIFFGNGISGNLFNPLAAGIGTHQIIYSYTTAGGCTNSDTISTQVIGSPAADAGSDILIPCGGSGGLIGSNPVYGMTYSWTPTIGLTNPLMSNTIANPTVGTNYTLTVKDTATGCTSTDMVLVDIIGGPVAQVTNDTIICKGESLTISASGGTSFSWSNGVGTSAFTISPNITTTYVVTVTNGACSDVDSVTVFVNAPYINLGPDVVLIDTTSFTLDAGYGFLSYLWNTGDTVQSITITPYINAALGLNKYGVAVLDPYGCIAGDSVNITYVLTIDELGENIGMKIFPNPGNGEFSLEITGAYGQNYAFEIANIAGQIVYSENIEVNQTIYNQNFDLRTLSKGVYILRIANKNSMRTYKLIIQ